LRNPEVHQLDQSVVANHDVLGLDVAVDDADWCACSSARATSLAAISATVWEGVGMIG